MKENNSKGKGAKKNKSTNYQSEQKIKDIGDDISSFTIKKFSLPKIKGKSFLREILNGFMIPIRITFKWFHSCSFTFSFQ